MDVKKNVNINYIMLVKTCMRIVKALVFGHGCKVQGTKWELVIIRVAPL